MIFLFFWIYSLQKNYYILGRPSFLYMLKYAENKIREKFKIGSNDLVFAILSSFIRLDIICAPYLYMDMQSSNGIIIYTIEVI